jgi:hypothetical protein
MLAPNAERTQAQLTVLHLWQISSCLSRAGVYTQGDAVNACCVHVAGTSGAAAACCSRIAAAAVHAAQLSLLLLLAAQLSLPLLCAAYLSLLLLAAAHLRAPV